mmetsp:Transcript_15532/g.28165  ORF Transcript_15532/g.28165 Transcript_15532/m.28165 type:complete len:80 (+) Transcript_15532:1016-1255(+)
MLILKKMIERVFREYSLHGQRYSMLNEWSNLRDSKMPMRISPPIFSCFSSGGELTLLTNFANGLLYCANILEESARLSE